MTVKKIHDKIEKLVVGNFLDSKIYDLAEKIQGKKKIDIEYDFTEIFWEYIILSREGTKTLKEALWKGNTEPVQLNFTDGIGDITYLNEKGELVLIEIKRTAGVFVDDDKMMLHSWQPGNVNEYSKDIIKTSLYAAGRSFWYAIRGLKGQGKLADKDPNFLIAPLIREIQEIINDGGNIKIKSEMVFLTTYRWLKVASSGENNLNRLSLDEAPIIGFHLQRVNMNKFVEQGIELGMNWQFPNGDNFELPKGSNPEEYIGLKYAYMISHLSHKVLKPGRKKPRIESFMIMVLYDLFSLLYYFQESRENRGYYIAAEVE
jgi:hypothetical protein